jgi:hypothetical protein
MLAMAMAIAMRIVIVTRVFFATEVKRQTRGHC